MLYGTLKYKENDYVYTYDVYGKDTYDALKLRLDIQRKVLTESGKIKTQMELDKDLALFDRQLDGTVDEKYKVDWGGNNAEDTYFRRIDIKKTNRFKTTIINKEFSCRLSAFLRYMQIAGKQNYNQNILQDIDEDSVFSPYREVEITEIATNTYLGKLNYNTGLITDIVCKNQWFEIELHTIPELKEDSILLKELKDKDRYGRLLVTRPIAQVGFKLEEEFLGFPYVPEIVKEDFQTFGMFETIEEVIANNPDKNTSWILGRDYHIVTDETLDQVMDEFYKHEGYIAYDTETSGLKINFKSITNEADQLVGVVLSKKAGEGYYFPLQHKLFPNLCNGDHFYFMEKYMRKLLEKKKIICHNLKFDWKVTYIYGINLNCVYDTMLALGVTKRYETPTYELSLKAVTKNIFGRDSFELSDFIMGGSFGDSDIAFWDLPYELVRQYAPADTDNTFALFEYIEKEKILVKYNAKKIFKLEITFAKAVAYSEFYGYHIDVKRIPELQENILNAMAEAKARMFKIAGEEFNPSSPTQLVKIMYEKLGIEKLGVKASTDKETLKALSKKENLDGTPKYPFVKALKDFRDNEGIYKNFLKKLGFFMTSDGFIFPDVLPLGTNTGRVSVKNPNYQSYNDTVKKYVTPREDCWHFDSDFSQIEQRVLVSLACIMFPKEEPLALLRDFDDPDMDYHQYQAARMFNVLYALVSKVMRQQSKGVNFGLPYGMGDSSLGVAIFGERTKENEVKAGVLRKKFFIGQELIAKLFEVVRDGGVKNGYTETQMGRRRYYQRTEFTEAEIRRQAGNHVIQGTAADLYKLSVCNLFERMCKEDWLGKVFINGFIHDEVLVEVHKSINPYYFFKAWREEFEVRPENYCRLYAGAGVGACWYDAKKLDLPPLYINEVINKYDEETDNNWDGDIEGFFRDIKENFAKHKCKRVFDYIQAKENQDTAIKPAIGVLLAEEIGKYITLATHDSNILKEINTIVEKDKLRIKDNGDCTPINDLQDQLRVFCYFNNVDYTTIDVLSAAEMEERHKGSNKTIDMLDDNDDDDDVVEVNQEELLRLSLLTNGIAMDYVNGTVHLCELWLNSTQNTPIQGTAMFINEKWLVQGSEGYKIMYYPNMVDGILNGTLIDGYVLPRQSVSTMLHYYREMIAKNFAYIIR